MFSIINNSKDIYFNLALEEYLLRNKVDDFFMVWQSQTAIVVGKHQNIMAEANHSFIREKNIVPARRITGGGTVFHGPGNLNFTIIMNGEPGLMVNFKYFLTPIIEFLNTLGISSEIGQHNDLRIDGRKISGNAEHVYKNRVLHHGTLLFDADLKLLGESIKVKTGIYSDRAVKSNRSEVCNILEYLSTKISMDVFASELNLFLMKWFAGTTFCQLAEEELKEVLEMRSNKYASSAWVFGYSPPFDVSASFVLSGSEVIVRLKVVKGIIDEAILTGSMKNNQLPQLSRKLKGLNYSYASIHDLLMGEDIEEGFRVNLLDSLF